MLFSFTFCILLPIVCMHTSKCIYAMLWCTYYILHIQYECIWHVSILYTSLYCTVPYLEIQCKLVNKTHNNVFSPEKHQCQVSRRYRSPKSSTPAAFPGQDASGAHPPPEKSHNTFWFKSSLKHSKASKMASKMPQTNGKWISNEFMPPRKWASGGTTYIPCFLPRHPSPATDVGNHVLRPEIRQFTGAMIESPERKAVVRCWLLVLVGSCCCCCCYCCSCCCCWWWWWVGVAVAVGVGVVVVLVVVDDVSYSCSCFLLPFLAPSVLLGKTTGVGTNGIQWSIDDMQIYAMHEYCKSDRLCLSVYQSITIYL